MVSAVRRTSLWIVASVVALACAPVALAPAVALAKRSKHRANKIEVLTPASGDVTIEHIQETVASSTAKKPELELFAPNERALPDNVYALGGWRTQRARHSTTFQVIVVVLDERAGGTATLPAPGGHGPNDVLAKYTPKLIGKDETVTVNSDSGVYSGVAFSFTQPLSPTIDNWKQQQGGRPGVTINVGTQPNANVGATDPRACKALTDVIRPGPGGKPAPGLTVGSFQGPGVLPWSPDTIVSIFDLFAECGHGGLDALGAALAGTITDAGLPPGSLGNPPSSPPPPTHGEALEDIIFGAALAEEWDVFEEATEDYVLWQEIVEIEEYIRKGKAVLAPRAHVAATGSGAVPQNGQVVKVEVRGSFGGGCPVKPESVCEDNLHFQDLRPQPDGKLKIESTTQAFTLPSMPGTYTYEPTNFFVQKGDFIGLASVGGRFNVLIKAPGAQVGTFVGHNKDMNGDEVSATKTHAGAELNMRVTLKPSA